MDALQEDPEVLSNTLLAHFSSLASDPVTYTLDTELCQRTTRSLTPSTPLQLLLRLLSSGESLLPTLAQTTVNIEPLTRLLQRTITLLPLDTLLSLLPPTQLITGLTSDAPLIQILCLAYLTKLGSAPSGAAFVASSADLTDTLLTVWLGTSSTEVAERSLESLIALLEVDQPPPSFPSNPPPQSQPTHTPLLWRRLFTSSPTYTLFYSHTTPNPSLSSIPHTTTSQSKQFTRAATTAQARLMDFLTRLARLDFPAVISHPFIAEVETRFTPPPQTPNTTEPYAGLLLYLNRTVDKDDILMATLYAEFAAALLGMIYGDDDDEDDDDDRPEMSSRSTLLPRGLLAALERDAGDRYHHPREGRGMNGENGLHL